MSAAVPATTSRRTNPTSSSAWSSSTRGRRSCIACSTGSARPDGAGGGSGMEIDIPEIVAEVRAAFERYEAALMGNDPGVLIDSFWASPLTLRYGIAENLYGIDEIAGYRRKRAAGGGWHARKLTRTVITTYGRDAATANTEYVRDATGRIGRQSQTWVRMPEGWRIVAAHVSLLADSRSEEDTTELQSLMRH